MMLMTPPSAARTPPRVRRGEEISWAVMQQGLAVLLEPGLRRLDRALAQPARQRPEVRPVIEMHEMGDLVRHQIVQHLGGCEHQPPRERHRGVGPAASPARAAVAYRD